MATTTCQRRGTDATVAEIIRELYSRAPARLPRTPIRSTAKVDPVSTVESGPPPPNGPGPPASCGAAIEPLDTAAAIAPNPIMTMTTLAMPTHVPRRLRILIHSAWTARPSVWGRVCVVVARTCCGDRSSVVVIRQPSRWCAR